MLPVFIGIGLGVLLGSIPSLCGIPGRVETGAGGRTADYGVDPRAYRQYRQAVLVYAAKRQPRAAGAGDRAVPLGRWSEIWWGFCEYPVNGEGLSWIGYGALITAVPLITVGILARMLAKMNYLTMCGMLAGSMTDPPALAFANNLHPTSGAAALSYATVYPLVMFLRIITPNYWRCSSGVSVNFFRVESP